MKYRSNYKMEDCPVSQNGSFMILERYWRNFKINWIIDLFPDKQLWKTCAKWENEFLVHMIKC
jgi:hypothetical protein